MCYAKGATDIPAQAEIHRVMTMGRTVSYTHHLWIPTFVGMT